MPTNNRLLDMALSLKKSGHDVTVYSRDSDAAPELKQVLNQEGISLHSGDAVSLLEQGQFDNAFLPLWFWNSQTVPESLHKTISEVSPQTKVAVLTDDAHASRRAKMAEFVNSQPSVQAKFARFAKADVADVAGREKAAYENADAVVAISEADHASIAPLTSTPTHVVHFASQSTVKPATAVAPMSQRQGVVFVGYAENPTNALGLHWFFSDVFPQLSQDMQSVTFNLVGAAPADNYDSLRALAPSANIVSHGMVSEEQMNQIVTSSRVMIAPIPASTGVNTKVYVGLSSGTPVVATSAAAAGLHWSSLSSKGALAVADSAADFAAALTGAYSDASAWNALSSQGHALAKAQLASGQFEQDMAAVLAALKAAPAKAKSFGANYANKAQLAQKQFAGRLLLAGSGGVVDKCADNPDGDGTIVCQNGGTCTDDPVLGATCECAAGFDGPVCQNNIDDCEGVTSCQNGGACRDAVDGFYCECVNGYTGTFCEHSADDCVDNLCQHGTCVDGVGAYTCNCAGTGYSGTFCETNDDDCVSNACQNGAACVDGVNTYSCDCTGTGFSGTFCETNVDNCADNECQNGGACVDGVNAYTCNCAGTGFEGDFCQTNIDNCPGHQCQNGAACVDGVNGYSCECATGYEGDFCQTNPDDCTATSCDEQGGTCIDGLATFTCFDACAAAPCQNDGLCVISGLDYTCVCPTGYVGTNCETNYDDCLPGACQNGGACVDGLATYTCTCQPGYSGSACETNIDDCASHPCGAGTCTDGVNGYTCDCTGTGYTGTNCETSSCSTFAQEAKPISYTAEHDAVAVSADLIITGAPTMTKPWSSGSSSKSASGAFIYSYKSDGAWSSGTYFYPSDATSNWNFGRDVALSGSTLAVSSWKSTVSSKSNAGSVYIYTISGSGSSTAFTQQGSALTAGSDVNSNAYFGTSIALDGDRLVVGAYGRDNSKGAAYAFLRTGSTWSAATKLTHPSAANNDYFGWSVSISGTTIAVGAYRDDGSKTDQGSVIIFKLSGSSGNSWGAGTILTASSPTQSGYFGMSVSLLDDTLLVGEPTSSSAGSVIVFTRTSSSASFVQESKIVAADGASGDIFGSSVKLLSATAFAVGAPQDDLSGASQTVSSIDEDLFDKDMPAGRHLFGWGSDKDKHKSDKDDKDDKDDKNKDNDGDGEIDGAPSNSNTDAGSVHIYCKASGAWSRVQVAKAADRAASRKYGRDIAYGGGVLAVTDYTSGAYVLVDDVNSCYPNPCSNGACNDLVGGFSCTCDAGYTGTTCDTNINDCSPNPCIHGACTDKVNGYECACEDGWEGDNCNTAIPVPCEWHGAEGVATDDWCTSNCNRSPYPYCPEECVCDGDIAAHGHVGCADGAREAFTDRNKFPNVAGCSGGWTVPGVHPRQNLVPTCERKAGDDGSALAGCSAADLCEEGWHVCGTSSELLTSIGDSRGCDAGDYVGSSVFFATRTTGNGNGACNSDPQWANDVFGCGNSGSGSDILSAGKSTCGGAFNKFSHNWCGYMPSSWYCKDDTGGWNEAYEIVHNSNSNGGVMCCKDTANTVDTAVVTAGPICEGATTYLRCAEGLQINILSAFYGRSSSSICTLNGANSNTACTGGSANALAKVIAECQGQESCEFVSGNSFFGTDPCSGTSKYTEVTYECRNPDGSIGNPVYIAPTIDTDVSFDEDEEPVVDASNQFGPICEGYSVEMFCPAGYVIDVTSASYGRTEDGSVCPHSCILTTTCEDDTSSAADLNAAKDKCDGETSCKLDASNGVFGDPCYGTYKYLVGTYDCIPNPDDNWKITVCSNPGQNNEVTVSIPPQALQGYLINGAFVGQCSQRKTVTVVLDIDFDSITDMDAFIDQILADLYSAVGVDPSLGVFFVSAKNSGSTVVSVDVLPNTYVDDPTALQPDVIAASLEAQVSDPYSPLMQGTYTSKTTTLTVTSYSESSDDDAVEQDTELAIIVGLVVGGGCILLAFIFFMLYKIRSSPGKSSAKVADSFDATVPSGNASTVPRAAGADMEKGQPVPATEEEQRLWTLNRDQAAR